MNGIAEKINVPILNAFQAKPSENGDMVLIFMDSFGKYEWSTYLGGNGVDTPFDTIVDEQKKLIYISGETSSSDFPIKNAYQNKIGGKTDGIVSCFDFNGNLQWSTFVGGENLDRLFSLALGHDGKLYIAGNTNSYQLPFEDKISSKMQKTSYHTMFVVVFNSKGELVNNKVIDGAVTNGSRIAVNNQGNIAIACEVMSFSPNHKAGFTTKLPYQDKVGGLYSSYFCRFDHKMNIDLASYYGGTDLKGQWNLSNIYLSSTNDLFITGSFDGLTTDNCKYVPMDSTLLPLKNEVSFMTIFNSDGAFKKVLLWGLDNKQE